MNTGNTKRAARPLSGRRLPVALITLLALGLVISAMALVGCQQQPKPEPRTAIQPEPPIIESLEAVHPDEPKETTFNERFSLDNALTRVDQVREASTATGEAGMAMGNWAGAIEGTLMKQNYLVKKGDFELAKYQLRDGEITRAQFDEKEAAFKKAEEDFKAFWSQFGIGD